jgi:hypothetical protein
LKAFEFRNGLIALTIVWETDLPTNIPKGVDQQSEDFSEVK